jgi:hypothetical protein
MEVFAVVIDASRLLLIKAILLVIVNDAQSFVTSQEAPAEQPQKQSHNTHAKRLTTKPQPLPASSNSQMRVV